MNEFRRYRLVWLDEKGLEVSKQRLEKEAKGTMHVQALIRDGMFTASQKKNKNPKRIILRRDDGSLRPAKEFLYFSNRDSASESQSRRGNPQGYRQALDSNRDRHPSSGINRSA